MTLLPRHPDDDPFRQTFYTVWICTFRSIYNICLFKYGGVATGVLWFAPVPPTPVSQTVALSLYGRLSSTILSGTAGHQK